MIAELHSRGAREHHIEQAAIVQIIFPYARLAHILDEVTGVRGVYVAEDVGL